MAKRDPFTTASADPRNAAANYPDLVAVEEVSDKVFQQNKSAGRLAAHIAAVRLIDSVQ